MKFIKRRYRTIIISLLGFIVVSMATTVSDLEQEVATAPAPEVITKTETVVETVVETKTPDACVEIIELDNKLFQETGGVFEIMANAVYEYDITQAFDSLTASLARMKPIRDALVLECLAS